MAGHGDFAAVPKSFVQRQGSAKAAGARFSSIRILSRGATPFPSPKRIELSELIGHPISSHAMAKPRIALTGSGKRSSVAIAVSANSAVRME
jgi:hypothetical protein